MPQLIAIPSGSASQTEVELKNEEGRLTFGTNAAGSDFIGVEFWDGTTWITLFKNGSALQATSLDNMQLVDGPGKFRFIKPASASLIIYIGTDSNAKLH